MSDKNFPEVIKEIHQKDDRYAKGAYFFIREPLDHTLKSLDKEGIAIVENILSKNESNYFKKKVIKILNDRKKNNLYVGNNLYQVIENYFVFDKTLFKLIFFEAIDQVMNNVIDSDYVLISSCARNSFYDKSVLTMSKTSGVGWHTDTR